MDVHCYRMVGKLAAELGPFCSIVEFGSYNCNGGVRPVFQGIPYTGIDLDAGPDVDIVADAATWTPEAAPDLVLCLSVLEHTPHGAAIIANARRILAPGGRLIVAAPAVGYPTHGSKGQPLPDGEHYANLTAEELRDWADGFVGVRVWGEGAMLYMVATKGADA